MTTAISKGSLSKNGKLEVVQNGSTPSGTATNPSLVA